LIVHGGNFPSAVFPKAFARANAKDKRLYGVIGHTVHAKLVSMPSTLRLVEFVLNAVSPAMRAAPASLCARADGFKGRFSRSGMR